jgi:hypothetical protein
MAGIPGQDLASHRLEPAAEPPSQEDGKYVVGLLIAGFAGAILVLYAAELIVKARARGRRLRAMNDRLAAATARAEAQQERRQAAARASGALTSVMPAISRPPLTGPDVPAPGAARLAAGGRTGPQDH